MRIVGIISFLAATYVVATPVAGQGTTTNNTPPTIDSVTFEIARNLTGDPSGPFAAFVPFDPVTENAAELDLLRVTFVVSDPDFNGMDGDGIFFLNQMVFTPVVGFPSPEPPPVIGDRNTFFPEQDGLKPPSGTMLTSEVNIQIPSFSGKNQARLRGLINFDVAWVFNLWVSNSQNPNCAVANRGVVTGPCQMPTALASIRIFAVENPALAPANPPAFADAGANQIVKAGREVTLDGSRTFDSFNLGFNPDDVNVFDKDVLSFTWEWISGPARVDPVQTSESDSQAAVTLDQVGTYVYRLFVDDNFSALPNSDTVTIDVVADLPTNAPPTAVIVGPARARTVGSTITLDGSQSSDPDGDTLGFRWRQTNILGEPLDPADLRDQFQPLSGLDEPVTTWQAAVPGKYFFRLLIDDGEFQSTTTFEVDVIEATTDTSAGTNTTTDTAAGANPAGDANSGAAASDGANTTAAPQLPNLCGAGMMPVALLPLMLFLVRRRIR